jgi:hypothetical protein
VYKSSQQYEPKEEKRKTIRKYEKRETKQKQKVKHNEKLMLLRKGCVHKGKKPLKQEVSEK